MTAALAPLCLLCAGLLPGPAAATVAHAAQREASTVSPQPATGPQGVERYRALAAAAPGLDALALSELLVAVGDDPVERALLAGLLHRRLARPEGPAAVSDAVRERGASLVPPLAGDRDWRVRLAAAELLGDLGTEQTIGAHRTLLADPVWAVRLRAIAALGALAPGENARLLEGVLARRDEASIPERREATRALARLGHTPGLLAGLADPDPDVQLNAIWGLGRQRTLPPEALQALEKTAREAASPRVREEIRQLLHRPAGKKKP